MARRISLITTALLFTSMIWNWIPGPQSAFADQFTVTRTDDTTTCAPGNCSLRGAIIAANASGGADVIILPAGVYTLTIPGADGGTEADNDAKKGDLDIIKTSHITIVGDGPESTIIDGNGSVTGDRVFDVNQTGILELGGVTIKNGKAGVGYFSHAHGAGIHNHGSLIMQNVVVTGNSVPTDNWGGGGITNAGAPVKASASLNNVTISENQVLNSNGNGGGIENNGFLDIMNSTIVNNVARNGAGISNRGTNAQAGLVNVTVSANHAIANGANTGLGGGIDNATSAKLVLVQATFALNSADTNGGNLAALATGGSVTPKSTIFAQGDVGGTPSNCSIEAGSNYTSGGFNLADDETCELTATGDLPSTNARLRRLKDNGGKTFTHALRSNSKAIDACNPAEFELTDQRGVSRPKDGNGDDNVVCDIGAFEAPTVNESNDDNGNDNGGG